MGTAWLNTEQHPRNIRKRPPHGGKVKARANRFPHTL